MGNIKSPLVQQLFLSTQDRLATLCERFKVEKLYLYGSAMTEHFSLESDLDIIVRFQVVNLPPEDRGQMYWDLLDALERLFDQKVDLLTDKKFSNPYFQEEVERTKTLIYDQSQSTKIII